MENYKIFFKPSVYRDFKPIPPKSVTRIMDRIQELARDPRPPGCQKRTNQEKYRIRQGKYRIIYSIRDNELTIWVVKVGKSIYR